MEGAAAPPRGDACSSLGCGFGDTTQRLAQLVGPEGEAVGIDVAEPFVEAAREDAQAAGVRIASFVRGDVQVIDCGRRLSLALLPAWGSCSSPTRCRPSETFVPRWSRTVASVRSSGAASSTTTGSAVPSSWSTSTSTTLRSPRSRPAAGPFSMANADTITEQLKIAGFEEIELRRCDLPIKIGDDLDHAVEFNMSLGPAGEVLRQWGDRVDDIRPKISRDLREALAEFDGPDGVMAPASTWIVTARAAG